MNKIAYIAFFLLFVPVFVSAQTVISVRDAENNDAISFELITSEGQTFLSNDTGRIQIALEEPGIFIIRNELYFDYSIRLLPDTSYRVYLSPKIQGLDPVIVTDVFGDRRQDQTVLNVDRISQKRIIELGAVDLRDVLAFESNIRLRRDNALGTSSMTLMGMGGNNVKVLINGVPVVGRMFDQVDLEQFNMENISQIEVVKGPMSVIYGSNALAGTINIITNSKPKRAASINLYHESDGQYNVTGTFIQPIGDHHLVSFSGGRLLFNGWSASDTDRTFDWIPKEQYNARLGYQYKNKGIAVQFRSELFHSFLLDRGKTLAPYFEDAVDQKYRNTRIDHSINVIKDLKDGRWSLMLSNNSFKRLKNKYFKDLISLNEQLVPLASEQDTQLFNAIVLRSIYNKKIEKWDGILGLDVNHESGTGPRILDQQQSQTDIALFSSLEHPLGNRGLLRAGMRYAYNSAFKSPLLYSLQSVYNLKSNKIIKLAYGKGFRAPSIKELYLDFNDSRHNVYGNANLRAETAHSFTGNYTQRNVWDKLSLVSQVEGFYNRIHDKIELSVLGPLEATYSNIGLFESVGGTITEKLNFKRMDLNVSATYIGVKNGIDPEEAGTSTQDKFYFSPQVIVQPAVNFLDKKLKVNLFINYFGALTRVFADTANSNLSVERLDPYTMIDVTAQYDIIPKRAYITCGIRNLAGIQTVGAQNTVSGAHTEGSDFLSISPGTTYFISFRYAFFK
ncbi:TonB-dependent receptor [bacterium]|nr:TonB-dependent receptor [bacterium]